MSVLKIYKENDDYVMERINDNATFKRHYSKAGLIVALQEYKTLGELEMYDIQASNEVWALVINALSQE